MRNNRYSMTSTRGASFERGWSAGMSARVFDTQVLPIFAFGLLMTGMAAYLGWNIPRGLLFPIVIVELILIFTASRWQRIENKGANVGLFLLLTALSGLSLVPLLNWAVVISGPQLIAQAFGVTALTFGGLVGYSLTTKKDFSGLGGFLIVALIGIIIASIVNIFIGGTVFSLAISVISVGIFSAFVLYDMSMIKQHYSDQDYIFAAIALYLDFILLFQHILNIMGIMSSRD